MKATVAVQAPIQEPTALNKAVCNCGAKRSDPYNMEVVHDPECSVYKTRMKLLRKTASA